MPVFLHACMHAFMSVCLSVYVCMQASKHACTVHYTYEHTCLHTQAVLDWKREGNVQGYQCSSSAPTQSKNSTLALFEQAEAMVDAIVGPFRSMLYCVNVCVAVSFSVSLSLSVSLSVCLSLCLSRVCFCYINACMHVGMHTCQLCIECVRAYVEKPSHPHAHCPILLNKHKHT